MTALRRCLLTSALALVLAGCGGGTSGSNPSASTSTGKGLGGAAARGQVLYQQDGCSDCHSLDGSRLTGPSWKGLAGSTVHLTNGRTVLADDAYLTRHIVEPQAFTVAGYPGEVMAQATAQLELRNRPTEVKALVAFIDSLR